MFRHLQLLLLAGAATINVMLGGCSAHMSDENGEGLGARSTGGTSAADGGSSAESGGTANSRGGSGTGGGASGGSGGSHPVPVIDPAQGSAGDGGTGMLGDGTPELCDGIDNDGNGIIDDVDAGNDGVCDCLAIGTIGQIGPWSSGGDIFASWLEARTPQGATKLDDQVLTPALLAKLQVIVVLHVAEQAVSNNDVTSAAHHAFSDDEAAAFADWVKNGGGAMSTIGYTQSEALEVVNVNRLLAPLGMAYSSTKTELEGYVQDWLPHPITMGISSINTNNGLEPDGPEGTTLARDPSGHVALQVAEQGDGHVVVWGDEWITYDSEWADVKGQQVELFWLNILKWLSPPKTCQVPIPPGVVK